MRTKERKTCDSCGSRVFEINFSKSKIAYTELSSDSFKVTNKSYGHCLPMVKCSNCDLIQMKPLLKPEEVLKLYKEVSDKTYLDDAATRSSSNYYQISRVVNKYLSSTNKVLEIGCGGGHTLAKLSKDFYFAEGLEPSNSLYHFAKNHIGVNIQNLGFEQYKTQTKFDCIVAIDVIEHVTSPKVFLAKINDLLNANGLAIIVTPTCDSIAAKALKKNWWHIRPPHLYYFSKNSFKHLAENCGLSVKEAKPFYWRLPIQYLFSAAQHLIFKTQLINLPIKTPVNINLHDSTLYVVTKR